MGSVCQCARERLPELSTTPRAREGPLVLSSAALLSIHLPLALSVLEL